MPTDAHRLPLETELVQTEGVVQLALRRMNLIKPTLEVVSPH